jgi:subtilisin family serine protease
MQAARGKSSALGRVDRPPSTARGTVARRGAIAAFAAMTIIALSSSRVFARRPPDPVLEVVSSHLIAGGDRGAPSVDAFRAIDAAGTLEVELRFDVLDAERLRDVVRGGAQIEHVSDRDRRVRARVRPEHLPEIARIAGLTAVHPLYGAVQNAGAVPGEGDTAIHADSARRRFEVDGTGVSVGILSDTFNHVIHGMVTGTGCDRRLTGASSQLSGDLPPAVVMLNDGPSRGSDEGAALAEIIHDIAPGAALSFASAYPDESTFADNIDALIACGARVLVDDVLFFAEPMFQDGIVAQAAQRAVDGDVAFFSAAGNQGIGGIDAVYRDAVPERSDDSGMVSGDDFHDFGNGNRFAGITVPAGCGIRLVLQWDEPFSGVLGPGAVTDLDLYLFGTNTPGGAIVAAATDTQGCARTGGRGGDPLEIASYINHARTPATVYVAVDHVCGRADVHFRVVTFPSCVLDQYTFDAAFTGPQLYGHPAAAGVAAVAAVSFADAAGALAPIPVEPFSASGGTLVIPLDPTGAPFAAGPERRFKPDLAAPDGVNTTFFGVDSPIDSDGFPNFFGTSAAAPHAAAVAALLREARPALAADALTAILRATARDVAAPGRDARAGDGLVDAEAALAAAVGGMPAATPTATPAPAATRTNTPGASPSADAHGADCNRDGRITIDELVLAVRIALGDAPLAACPGLDENGDGRVGIDEIVRAVARALQS